MARKSSGMHQIRPRSGGRRPSWCGRIRFVATPPSCYNEPPPVGGGLPFSILPHPWVGKAVKVDDGWLLQLRHPHGRQPRRRRRRRRALHLPRRRRSCYYRDSLSIASFGAMQWLLGSLEAWSPRSNLPSNKEDPSEPSSTSVAHPNMSGVSCDVPAAGAALGEVVSIGVEAAQLLLETNDFLLLSETNASNAILENIRNYEDEMDARWPELTEEERAQMIEKIRRKKAARDAKEDRIAQLKEENLEARKTYERELLRSLLPQQ